MCSSRGNQNLAKAAQGMVCFADGCKRGEVCESKWEDKPVEIVFREAT